MAMHSDKVQAHAETYIGLVEFGAGLIPGGGGTKEMAVRISDSFTEGDIELPELREKFLTLATAKVSTSAYEAYGLGYLRKGHDEITLNRSRLLADAKATCIRLAEEGYTQPVPRKDIKVLGKQGLGMIYVGADVMQKGNYMSEHDKKISLKLGNVILRGRFICTNFGKRTILARSGERSVLLSLRREENIRENAEYFKWRKDFKKLTEDKNAEPLGIYF